MPRIAAPASNSARSRGRERAEPLREVRHVERAGDAVDQRDADQEQDRSRQVDDDVVQPGRTRVVPTPRSMSP